jgi:hypothetical protein
VILAAPRKAGKTTIVGSLVRSLIDGDPWLGRYHVTPVTGSVALIDTEMSRGMLRRWYRQQFLRATDRVIVRPLRGCAGALDVLDPLCRARWQDWILRHSVQYIIVDCLRPVLDALNLDESHEAGRWLVGFDTLLRDAGVPEACIVHHMGHNAERSRGDSRLRDWPDVEWRLVRQDEDDASPRYIAAYGRDVNVPESQLRYDAATRQLTLSDGSRRDARTRVALDAVVKVLEKEGDARTGREIKRLLVDSLHGKHAIDAALRLGLRQRCLLVEDGPHNAYLYRLPGGAVSPSVPPVSQEHTGENLSQCLTPSLEGDTRDISAAINQPTRRSHARSARSSHSSRKNRKLSS